MYIENLILSTFLDFVKMSNLTSATQRRKLHSSVMCKNEMSFVNIMMRSQISWSWKADIKKSSANLCLSEVTCQARGFLCAVRYISHAF